MNYVYFVQPVQGGPIKIGKTNDLAKRLSGLQTGSPLKLALRHYVEAETSDQAHALERSLHMRYGQWRVHGEWFDACPALAEEAHAIADPVAVVPRRCKRAASTEQMQMPIAGDGTDFGLILTIEEEDWFAAQPTLQESIAEMNRERAKFAAWLERTPREHWLDLEYEVGA